MEYECGDADGDSRGSHKSPVLMGGNVTHRSEKFSSHKGLSFWYGLIFKEGVPAYLGHQNFSSLSQVDKITLVG